MENENTSEKNGCEREGLNIRKKTDIRGRVRVRESGGDREDSMSEKNGHEREGLNIRKKRTLEGGSRSRLGRVGKTVREG